MPVAIQAIICTPDLDRLIGFYTSLLGAVETTRVPEDGPAFFVSLRLHDSELGLVSKQVDTGQPGRMLLSIEVEDVDALLDQVDALGGHANPANDMPWGQRVAHITDPDGNAVNLTHTQTQ